MVELADGKLSATPAQPQYADLMQNMLHGDNLDHASGEYVPQRKPSAGSVCCPRLMTAPTCVPRLTALALTSNLINVYS